MDDPEKKSNTIESFSVACSTPTYMMDMGSQSGQISLTEEQDFTGWNNHRIVPELNDNIILERL